MQEDCIKLKEASVYVRAWLNQQPSVKEESLTDWLLFDVSSKIKKITYKAFTRNEEAKLTGADWEWWFLFEHYCYKFRVQAKKIKTNGDNYSSLAYSNKNGLQIKKLIKDSIPENYLPVYAFYTSTVDHTKCGRDIIDEGVYIAGAMIMEDKFIKSGRRIVYHNDILVESIPLSCMLCCPIIRDDDIRLHPHNNSFSEFIKRYFMNETLNSDSKESLGQHSKIPNYVNSILSLSSEKYSSEWEKEYAQYIKDINSILIFDARYSEQ